MKTRFTVALLAVGFTLSGAGIAAADPPSVGFDPGAVIEHHSTAHNIGPCGLSPCPPKPKPNLGR